MTMDYIRTVLDEQNKNPECTDAQRAANAYRLHMYELLTRGKSPYEPRQSLDVIIERLTTGKTHTPNSLLS